MRSFWKVIAHILILSCSKRNRSHSQLSVSFLNILRISRKAELWSADCEEFIYLFDVEHLTREIFEQCRDYARKDGMERAHIGPGHMYTYITPVFICDACDEEARKALKKCRIYQSFHFSLHGWMDFHAAVLEVNHNKITTNRNGKCVEKVMKNVLFQKKRRRIL